MKFGIIKCVAAQHTLAYCRVPRDYFLRTSLPHSAFQADLRNDEPGADERIVTRVRIPAVATRMALTLPIGWASPGATAGSIGGRRGGRAG